MVKNFLFFSEFGCGYLREWPTRLRSSSYGVAGKLTTKTRKHEEFLDRMTGLTRIFDADYARLAQIYSGFVGGLSSKKFA